MFFHLMVRCFSQQGEMTVCVCGMWLQVNCSPPYAVKTVPNKWVSLRTAGVFMRWIIITGYKYKTWKTAKPSYMSSAPSKRLRSLMKKVLCMPNSWMIPFLLFTMLPIRQNCLCLMDCLTCIKCGSLLLTAATWPLPPQTAVLYSGM